MIVTEGHKSTWLPAGSFSDRLFNHLCVDFYPSTLLSPPTAAALSHFTHYDSLADDRTGTMEKMLGSYKNVRGGDKKREKIWSLVQIVIFLFFPVKIWKERPYHIH